MYKGDPNVKAPPQDEVEAFNAILKNKPPVRSYNEISLRTYTKFSIDGFKYTETISSLRSKIPEFRRIEDDLIDSFWFYPVIEKRVVATTTNKIECSHSEYFKVVQSRKQK